MHTNPLHQLLTDTRARPLVPGGQPTSVFLPGESHGQRSLTGCSPWGHTTE